ncbi:replicative DNA helicase [Raineyella sp.]|uniref:replicative DNA helicase n=1 Tax=Raineyella sp. TaxID=1911550 RepID=UPI002B21385D|nr:replicative DNA helicase [Raineyella sp.]MEA5153369.1 replicative DNA helicase [Raineyella sp.]
MGVVGLEPAWSTDHREPGPGPDRQPPQDLVAEQSVLGAMMISKDAIAEVIELVHSDDFYKPAHELIFDAILHLYSLGEPADAITVAEQLTKRGEIARVGGHTYLYDLVASVSVAANAGYYAQIVRDKAVLRRLVQASIKIAQLGYNAEGDVDDIVDEAQATMYAIADRRSTEDYKPLEQLIEPTMDQMELIEAQGGVMSGVPTGFAELDELTAGLHSGQMVIIAARPGMGKSTLGLDICRSASIKHGLTSCIFSLEMSQTEITMRMLSAEASVPLSHMRQGTMSSDEWDRVSSKASLIGSAPLYVDDSPNLTMMEIRAKARRLKQQHDLKLIVLDYLQLMSSGKKVESRQLEVSEFSRQMKLLAKELELPVIAISQLNRNPEKRDDKRPSVSDLRESGSLEQDADVIILVHRDDYYNKDESDRVGEADIIVAKHRNGPTKTVTVAFQGHYSRFTDMAH